MMKKVIVVLLAVILCFAAVEARRKCVESVNVECKYERKCVALKNVCARRVTKRGGCVSYGKRRVWGYKKQKVCVKWNRSVRVKGNRCQKCVKTAFRHKRIRVWKAYCKRHGTRRVCTKYNRVCKRHKAVKRCWVIEHEFNLRGPKKCRAGKKLVFKRSGKTIRRRCVKSTGSVGVRTCSSYLDPHTTGFNGRNFEFQYSGDRVMAETSDGVFALHQRLQRFGSFTGTTGMAVRVNGRDVLEYLGRGRFTLNGKPVNIKNGVQFDFPEGGFVVVRGNHIEVIAANGARALYVDYGPYANLNAYVPTDIGVSAGYCSGDNVSKWASLTASGLFQFRRKVRFLSSAVKKAEKKNKPTRRQKRNARVRCQAAGLKGVPLRNCVKDVIRMRGTGQTNDIIRIIKRVPAQRKEGRKRLGFWKRVGRSLRRL